MLINIRALARNWPPLYNSLGGWYSVLSVVDSMDFNVVIVGLAIIYAVIKQCIYQDE